MAGDLDGGTLFQKRCAACHNLPDPNNPPADGWETRLKQMAPLARLNSGQQDAVLGYLIGHSQAQGSQMALAEDKLLFEQKCGQCHTMERVFIEPLTEESLRHLVSRMQEKDAESGISQEDANRIVNYLTSIDHDGKTPEALAETSSARELFAARCLSCHSEERIKVSFAETGGADMDWTHVVDRMQAKAPQWIAEDEARVIISYLRSLKAGVNDQ